MDGEGISQLSAPISSPVDHDTTFDDVRRLIASWDDDNQPIEDATRRATTGEIEGPSVVAGELQPDRGLDAMAPLDKSEGSCTLQELNPLHNCLFSIDEIWDLGLQHPDRNQNLQQIPQDPVESRNDFQNSLDLEIGESAPSLNPHESVLRSAHGTAEEDPGNVLQTCFDLYRPESEPEETHDIDSASRQVEGIYTEGDHHEQELGSDHSLIPTCNICLVGNAVDRVVTTCGHAFCRSCLSQDEAKPCPECNTLLSMDANVMTTSYANLEMETENYNVESREACEFESAPELMIYPQGCYDQPGFAAPAPQNRDFGTQGLNQGVQDLTQEYQPQVHHHVWQSESDPFRGLLRNEAVAESEPSDVAVPIFNEIELQANRKRGREKLVVDHNGVAMWV